MSSIPISQENPSIEILIHVKRQLEKIPIQHRYQDYTNILSQVNAYLYKYCAHTIDHDLIDIDPDTSIEIEYCTICGTTFS